MNKVLALLLFLGLESILADSDYYAPSYSAPSYSAPSYSAPSYSAPSYKNEGITHTHHHYYHDKPTAYQRPSYRPQRPSYRPQQPSYRPPVRYEQYAPQYGYQDYDDSLYYEDDQYIHLNRRELTKSALLLGAGVLKGVIITGLINNANNGITIGKK